MAARYINISGFSPKLNKVVNDAIALATEYNNDRISNLHFFYSIITKNSDIQEKFCEEFNDETFSTVTEKIREKFEQGRIIGDATKIKPIGIDDRTEDLDITFRWLLSNTPGLADIDDAYEYLVHGKDSSIVDFMIEVGALTQSSKGNVNYLTNCRVLSKFASDMNFYDRKGAFDPISSRDDIIDKLVETLGRRQKCNPVLIGEPGVGKTAIIEGLVNRLNEGNVPSYLKDVHIINVDVSSIVAGSTLRGEFEQRLNDALYEAPRSSHIILFFDEIHMLMEAGGSSSDNVMNAANILKPAISKGDVQIIGATTLAEYKKYIEKDKAFERRLQPIVVSEPDIDMAIHMINTLKETYEDFHNITFDAGVIETAVKLSDRYITDRKLPDKAITVIDSAAAHVKNRIEEATDGSNKDTIEDENEIILTVKDIIETVSNISGVDINELSDDGKTKLKNLSNDLKKHVIGQDEAIDIVSKAIRRSKAGVNDPDKPIGTFLFVGPTGVGKTELVKALAIEFGHGLKNLIRFDMSEFMEKHSVARLIGAPPGYVGFGNGGELTEAVKRNPYSILLFDEIEKAHPDVFNIMLQILDDGQLTDSEGTKVNFRNCVIIMTSNAGYKAKVNSAVLGFGNKQENKIDKEKEHQETMKTLEKTFRPEFLNRIDKVVIFNELDRETSVKIISLLLNKVTKRLDEKNIKLTWDETIENMLIDKGFDEKYGARNLKRAIQEHIEDTLADAIINGDIGFGDKINLHFNTSTNEVEIERVLMTNLNKNLGSEGDKVGNTAEACGVSVRNKKL